jgi:hypothetical protein
LQAGWLGWAGVVGAAAWDGHDVLYYSLSIVGEAVDHVARRGNMRLEKDEERGFMNSLSVDSQIKWSTHFEDHDKELCNMIRGI